MRRLYFFLAAQNSGDLAVYSAWVCTPEDKQKHKDRVYTPMIGSPTTNIMVYTHFRGSPKIKV